MSISEQIKLARLSAGISQDALAELIGSDQKQIYRWENGKQSPSVDKLELIAKALKCKFVIE